MPAFELFADTAPADEAAELARRWAELRARRIVLAGCGCGFPSAHIAPAEIEADIVAYLVRRYRNAGSAVAELLGGCPSLSTVLQRLQLSLASSTDAVPLLRDIARSLSSFERPGLRCRPAATLPTDMSERIG